MLVLGFAAYIVITPEADSQRIFAMERSAVATLREIHRTQESFLNLRSGSRYALLEEIADRLLARPGTGGSLLSDGDLRGGILERDGFAFAVYLPGSDDPGALHPRDVDPERASIAYAAFAWPLRYGRTGRRVFAMGPDGTVRSLENSIEPYEGREDAPPPVLLSPFIDGQPFGRAPPWVVRLRWAVEP